MNTKQTPPWKAENKRAAIAGVFQKILDQKTWDAFNPQDLRIQELYISERPGVTVFSDAFLESMFPRFPAPAEVYHYTPMPVFLSVAQTSEMRMYAAEKWISEGGELLDFARDHNLQGYLEKDKYYETLAKDLFCLCATRDLCNETYSPSVSM